MKEILELRLEYEAETEVVVSVVRHEIINIQDTTVARKVVPATATKPFS